MRNLKRALSLALASVMLLGMMVVGAGAASYTDVSSEDNVEAIEVLNAVKVMIGKQGNFDPDAPVNRHEMAVIMAKLYLGTEAADNYVGTHPFTDVYPWADKYVAACYENGLISGTSKTTYGGNQPLTAIQAAAMMLRALGYEDLSKGAADWRTPVAAKANQIRLFKDVVSNPSAQLTRNQVAQLALNTLKADVVETERGADVTIGDVAISTSIKYNRVELSSEGSDNYAGDGGAGAGYLQLCEKLYEGELTFGDADAGDDDFGRPASKWTYGKTEVLVNKTPSVTFVDKTSEADVKKAVKGYDYPADTSKWENGKETANQTMTDAAIAALTGDGTLVEIYTDSDKKVTDVVVVTYSVDTVKSITEKNGKTTYKFETATSKYNDEDNTNVIIDGSVDEGDVVTIAKVGSKYYVYPTTSFTANQTAKKTSDGTTTVTIGGDKYVVATGAGVDPDDFTNSKDDATYYLDKNGFVVKVEDLEKEAAEYAVIAKVEAAKTNATLDDDAGYTVKVRAVLADGTIADYTLKTSILSKEDATEHTGDEGDLVCGDMIVCDATELPSKDVTEEAFIEAVKTNLGKAPVGYTLDDGKMVLETVAEATAKMTKDEKYGIVLDAYKGGTSGTDSKQTATALMTKNTVFVLFDIDKDGKVTVEAPKTGTADLSLSKDGVNGIAIIKATNDASGEAELVFLEAKTAAKEEDYVYIDASEYTTELDEDDKNIDVWEGIAADGSTVRVTGKHDEITKDGLYVYDTDGKLDKAIKIEADPEGEDYAEDPEKGGYYLMTADVSSNLIKVGKAYVDMTDAEVVSVDEDGAAALENGAMILVVMSSDDKDKVAAIFVFQAAPEEDDGDKKEEEKHEHDYKWAKATEEDVTAAAEAKITIEKDEHVLKCEGKTGECDAVYKADGKHKVDGITEEAAGKLTPACTLDSHTGS